MLTLLPESGDNYLPVFSCVRGFCTGEGFLSTSDEPLLVEQLKLFETAMREGGGEGSGAAGEESVDSDTGKREDNCTFRHNILILCVCMCVPILLFCCFSGFELYVCLYA